MNIDGKLFRTLVLAGFVLILFHNIISNWGDFKRGLSAGYTAGHEAAAKP